MKLLVLSNANEDCRYRTGDGVGARPRCVLNGCIEVEKPRSEVENGLKGMNSERHSHLLDSVDNAFAVLSRCRVRRNVQSARSSALSLLQLVLTS